MIPDTNESPPKLDPVDQLAQANQALDRIALALEKLVHIVETERADHHAAEMQRAALRPSRRHRR